MHENAQKKNLIEKHLAKLRALSHSMVKVFCGKDAFSEILRLEASPVIIHCKILALSSSL